MMFERGKQFWQKARAGALLCCALLTGCSFGNEKTADAPNTCTLPTDCPAELSCQQGVCVMPAPEPLDVTLEITPKRMPDGLQPFPILFGPFPLQAVRRNFNLAMPTVVTGTIKRGSEMINAQLTFVPTKAPASLARPIQARTSLIGNAFSAQLLSEREYRVTVQPTEAAALPTYTTMFTATPNARLDIDYATLPSSTQNYWIKNLPSLPDGYKLRLKARAKDTNQVISNTAELGEGGRAPLMFLQDTPPPHKLEIIVEKSFGGSQLSGLDACDASTPLVPTFSVDDSALKREARPMPPGAYDLTVELPKLPAPIQYAGTIQLCEASKGFENLLVSLRSSGLAISNMPQGISASFSVSASADRESPTRQKFCTRVVPGEYVVLVTPPANVTCEIFAQRRQILAATDDEPTLLDLRAPTKLNGKIVDNDMAPMANATIDAIALGIDSTDLLAENDPTVPNYNRSRQTSSDSNGSFALYVDVGVYDLIVKPPMQSGYGWQIRPGLSVGGARREDFATRVELSPPSLVEGSLHYPDAKEQASLAGADVHAYTVEDEGTPNARGVEIGHTQADEDGNVMLLISPVPRTSW